MDNTFINRDIRDHILDNMRYFPVLTLTGPRQSGKTTLIKNMFPDMPYYSLENLDTRQLATADPVAFLSQHEAGMILDEAQRAPELLSYIQGIVDEHPERRYVLTGSSEFSLLSGITQSLAGRSAVVELMPFSLHEIANRPYEPDRLILDGFYPAIHSGKNIARLFYPAYTRTYLERDVRQLLNVENLAAFQTFLRLCAGRIGSLFNASELSNEVGISVNTIRSWMSILQASYLVTLLPPYYDNGRKRLTKTPKIYFYDTGLACYLLGIETPEQLSRDKMRGHLFENMVIMDVLKNRLNAGRRNDLMFYRDSNGNEIDLLVPEGPGYHAYEIKSAMTYNGSFEKSFKSLSPTLDERITRRAIIYNGTLENAAVHIALLNYRTFLTREL